MEDARLDGSHGNAQLLSDFIVMKTVQEHGERHLEFRLQTINGGENVLFVDDCGHRIGIQRSTGIEEVLVVRAVHNGVLEFLALVVVDEDVAHDRVQPTLDVGPLLEIVLVPQGLHHGVLDQIVRILRVTGEADGKAFEEIAVVDQEVVEFQCAHDA